MKLQQQLEKLDARVLSGDIIGAFDEFFADTCITHSNPQDVTRTKTQKTEALRWFFNNVGAINRIERLGSQTGDTETYSQFVFDFSDRWGNPLVFHEVIRRVWADGKVVEEQYLMGESLDNLAPVKTTKAAAATAKKANSDAEKPAKAAAEKAAPVIEKPVAKKAAAPKPAPAKKAAVAPVADDLAKIEGIGPKIAELLVKGGIATFADLAAAKPAAIQKILDAAGKRYQMHDPASWPKQAALARDGKTAELQKLQDQLKGGRK